MNIIFQHAFLYYVNILYVFLCFLLHLRPVSVAVGHPFAYHRKFIEIKKSERVQNRFFSFMNPLAVEIWFYIALAYVLVSLTIWIVARFSPFEWQLAKPACGGAGNIRNRHKRTTNEVNCTCPVDELPTVPMRSVLQQIRQSFDQRGPECNYQTLPVQSTTYQQQPDVCHDITQPESCPTEPTTRWDANLESNADEECCSCCADDDGHTGGHETELLSIENDFTLTNSFWFAIGTLMQQGSDLNPKVFFFHICIFRPQCFVWTIAL